MTGARTRTGAGGRGAALLLAGALTAACAPRDFPPVPLTRDSGWQTYAQRSLQDEALRGFAMNAGVDASRWPPERWDFEALTVVLLYFNPQLAVARARWQLRLAERQSATQRPRPALDVQLEHHSDTDEAGEKLPAWAAGFVFELLLERPQKRAARQGHWDALAAAARLDVEAAAWDLRTQLRRQLLSHYDAAARIDRLQDEGRLWDEAVGLLERRQTMGEAGSFEVSSARLRQSQVALQLARARAALVEARGGSGALLGIPEAAFAQVSIDWSDLTRLPPPQRLSAAALQRDALLNRHDLGKALQDYAAEDWAVQLAVEERYPDVKLSPGYLFDQNDNVWMVGIGWVLPWLRNPQPALTAALARRDLAAARFRARQLDILARVERALARYGAQYAVLAQARALVEQQHERVDLVARQLQLGYADRLDHLRAQLEASNAELGLHDVHVSTLQAYAQLEAVIQRPIPSAAEAAGQ